MQKVCVQGLGFVGSAMATAVALARDEEGRPRYDVLGVDLPTDAGLKRVAALNAGRFPFETSDPKLNPAVASAHAGGNLRATTDDAVYAEADIIVVDVHLDIPFLDDEPQLQFEGFEKAIRTIGARMRPDALVIVETTVPPGTCEKVVVPCLTQELQRRGLDAAGLRVAHSYERVMPGKEYLDSVINFWRVYSGHTPEAADACEAFLASIINVRDYPLTRLSSTTASETAKVMENTYRAVNISFICEWTRYAEKVGIDLFEVVKAIQVRPTHQNIRYPGLGIGGYCLTKDPTFAPAAARQLFGHDLDFPFSRLAVRAATEMPHHGVTRLEGLLGGSVKGRRILLCGVSYRQDVADTRYSPSETVYRELTERGAEVVCHDPFVRHWEELDMEIPEALPGTAGVDAVMFAIPHSQYQALDLVEWVVDKGRTVVLDAYMVFDAAQRRAFRELGVRIESIGVGDGQ
ncbi:nucleotide sugar dehydrogenase [Ectothiorhodospira haloalkaliphila]|uniref:nucleotide sugar dehydrogenase n=1 Tax=Ectothiorhodospira haloalkaliphila TaxID=421628 RepID=UPI001EE986F4|nr:nucleotide sugar dehydrogenase [Ectothiorhodospira haloalkaliphila]MCG5525284.1 nucleotide sugar dehydrogenase [Ectothiorhodospira haloalkaliphila]